MAPKTKTVLEISDEMLRLPAGTWLVATEAFTPKWSETMGHGKSLAVGDRFRLEGTNPRAGTFHGLTEEAFFLSIDRKEMANFAVEPVKRTFKVSVSQMVERIGTFEVEALSVEEAVELAKIRTPESVAIGTDWDGEEIRHRPRVFALHANGVIVWGRACI